MIKLIIITSFCRQLSVVGFLIEKYCWHILLLHHQFLFFVYCYYSCAKSLLLVTKNKKRPQDFPSLIQDCNQVCSLGGSWDSLIWFLRVFKQRRGWGLGGYRKNRSGWQNVKLRIIRGKSGKQLLPIVRVFKGSNTWEHLENTEQLYVRSTFKQIHLHVNGGYIITQIFCVSLTPQTMHRIHSTDMWIK